MKLDSASALPRGVPGAHPRFVQALSSDDLDAAAACFARDGCLITPDATAIHGRDRIRPVLAQMVACRTRVRVEASNSIGTGEVILAHEQWKIRIGGPQDAVLWQSLSATLVLRRIEGAWKLEIAAPWGRGWARP